MRAERYKSLGMLVYRPISDVDDEFLPVLTKSDKVSNNQIFKLKQEVQRKTGVREVLAISALKDQGIKELRTRLINYSLIDE